MDLVLDLIDEWDVLDLGRRLVEKQPRLPRINRPQYIWCCLLASHLEDHVLPAHTAFMELSSWWDAAGCEGSHESR